MSTVLVTVLGTNPQDARYTLDGQSHVGAKLAPVALVKLLPEAKRPKRVLALCTPQARRDSWPLLEKGLAGCRIELDSAEVSDDQLTGDITLLPKIVFGKIPEQPRPAAVLFDVTHGPRHHALLTLLAIQYLRALRDIHLQGAYYAWLSPGAVSPFVDLRPLLDLFEWIHALRTFNESADASQLARLIETDGTQQARRISAQARRISTQLREISRARMAGLPLELGLLSASFLAARENSFRKVLKARGALLEGELWRRLEAPIAAFALQTQASVKSKKAIRLTKEELLRQSKLIDELFIHGNTPAALGLLNEWTVSWAVLRAGETCRWLDYGDVRRPAAAKLGLLGSLSDDNQLGSILKAEQRALGKFWRTLSDLRNAFHHHGMRPQKLIVDGAPELKKKLAEVQDYWKDLKDIPHVDLELSATETLLVSALGRSPGVLYSAIEACRRERISVSKCLVLCSNETAASVNEAVQRAGYAGGVALICLASPYGDKAEIDRIQKAAREHLVEAREVLVNLTGGTTLMGLAVAAIADEAERFARPMQRFGLIDPRPPAEQQANPYRASEAFWLEEKGARDD